MKAQVAIVLVVLSSSWAAPQNRKAAPRQQSIPQQQSQQQNQQPQFTKRFNPNDNNQQDFYEPQQQQQTQQRASNNVANVQREATTFIPIIRFDKEQSPDGGYKTLWETGNNILAEETGILKNFGTDQNNADAVVQQGSYTYTSPEGQVITVQYTADERGFRATGDHIPTPPPIPAEIQKSLDTIYAGIAEQQRQGGSTQYQGEGQYNEEQYNPQSNRQQQQNNQQQDNINFRPTGNKNNRGFRQ